MQRVSQAYFAVFWKRLNAVAVDIGRTIDQLATSAAKHDCATICAVHAGIRGMDGRVPPHYGILPRRRSCMLTHLHDNQAPAHVAHSLSEGADGLCMW